MNTFEINANGDKYWTSNGVCHREDGPAVECTNGDKFWYIEGSFHREDGPAIEYSNGNKSWYLNDKEVTEQDVRTLSND